MRGVGHQSEQHMSGSRQHFIPRFLMRGFSSKIRKRSYYTWVFTKDNDPYEPNILNIGLERYFYENQEYTLVDEKITEQETKFGEELERIRAIERSCTLDRKFPTEFITHLIVRAKHIRLTLQQTGETLLGIAKEELDSPNKFAKMIINLVKNRPDLIEESLHREFSNRLPTNLSKDQIDHLVKVAISYIPEILTHSHMIDGYVFFNRLFSLMADKMPDNAKDAQLRGLSKEIVPTKFVDRFKGISHWVLRFTKQHSFILGDIGPIGFYAPDNDFRPFIFAKGELSQIFLPISSSQIIVGKTNAKQDDIEVKYLNEASASLSQLYFISNKNNESERNLSKMISTKAINISSDEIINAKVKFKQMLLNE